MSRMFTFTYVAQSTRILRLLLMVHKDLLEASPFMYGVAVEMRREYEGMVNVSMGSWEYKLSFDISIRFGIRPSIMQLLTY